jgi:hypothetical protein
MIIYPLLLASQLVLVADTVPQFDSTAGCPKAATEAALNRSIEACRTDEDNAKKTLSDGWTKFPANDRGTCDHMIRMGGQPSYVELLTCLELAQQTKGFSKTVDTPAKR